MQQGSENKAVKKWTKKGFYYHIINTMDQRLNANQQNLTWLLCRSWKADPKAPTQHTLNNLEKVEGNWKSCTSQF
jgi:hypothetical protein